MAASALNYQPLYKQIKALILQRVIDGVWPPGTVLPSEQQLGNEFGVSQGTIRKALDEMTAENIFVRKQGKGTFVARHSANRSLFHFFYIISDDGKRIMPDGKVISINKAAANKSELDRLELDPGDKVIRIKRVRLLNKKPIVAEQISLPSKLYGDLGKKETIPKSLYEFYETQFDVKVMKAKEKLKAVALKKEEAALLDLAEGSPVLEIERVAISLDQKPVEWRLSYVDTRNYYYLSELT